MLFQASFFCHITDVNQSYLFGHVARASPEDNRLSALLAAVRKETCGRTKNITGRPRTTWSQSVENNLAPMTIGLQSDQRRAAAHLVTGCETPLSSLTRTDSTKRQELHWRGAALPLSVHRWYNSEFLFGPQRRVWADSPRFVYSSFIVCNSFCSLLVFNKLFYLHKIRRINSINDKHNRFSS